MSDVTKVLVVDDSATDLQFAKDALTAMGAQVETSKDIWVAPLVTKLQPHLILMDVNIDMNENGPIVVSQLKEHKVASCKIVLYSSSSEDKLKEHVAKCGADGYIVKSGDVSALQEEVKKYL